MLTTLLLAALPLTFAGPIVAPRAPVITPRSGQVIPNKYIVKFKSDALEDVLTECIKALTNEPDHVYGFGTYRGFAAEFKEDILDLITALPGVEYVEKDAIMTANLGFQKRDTVTQPSAPWGLSRISHVDGGNSTGGINATSYLYDSSAGEETCAYVIDTGIYTEHPDFEGRAEFLANYAGDNDDTDGNGHGTHVAGTIGSKTYGVAKKTKLFAVKVLDANGEGANSGVIAGIDFAANDQKNRTGCAKGSVANLSLGGEKSDAVNNAAADAVEDGLFMAVAAGNEAQDASNSSPASEETVYTVGATDASDNLAEFSNFGSFVDILAPGVDILSTWNDGKSNTISGTSMASPHIAGLAAYILALEGKKSPADLSSRLTELATKDIVQGLDSNTVNLLAYNGINGASSGGIKLPIPDPTDASTTDDDDEDDASNSYPEGADDSYPEGADNSSPEEGANNSYPGHEFVPKPSNSYPGHEHVPRPSNAGIPHPIPTHGGFPHHYPSPSNATVTNFPTASYSVPAAAASTTCTESA